MAILETLKFVQWAVARKNFVEELTHFQIKDGFIRSFNGSISLCSPIELNLNCMPKANAFIKAISTCRDTVQLSMTPTGRLSVKSGKFRALVECLPSEFPEIAPEGHEIAVSGALMGALKALEPIIGEDASRPWSRGIMIRGNFAYATNNIVLAKYCIQEPIHDKPINIPHAAVNELLRIKEYPVKALVTDDSITFMYEDGQWLRTTLFSTEWPDVDAIIAGERDGILTEVPENFWQGLEDIAPFADEFRGVFFKPNYLTTHLDPEVATYINVPGLIDMGKFNIDMWRMLSGLTTSIVKGKREALVFFTGPNVEGALIGMRG